MIYIDYVGRMGNQMCQYAFARLLAEQLGHRLFAGAIPGLPNTRELVPGRVIGGRAVVIRDDRSPGITVDGRLFDCPTAFDEIANLCKDKPVVIRGHFEQSHFFIPHRDKLLKWFAGPSSSRFENVVCLRGTDVRLNSDIHISADYYNAALDIIGRQNTVIITDDPNWDYVQSFGLLALNMGQQANFQCFRGAKRVVLSKSTFSWWAAFLGNASMIVQPDPVTKMRKIGSNCYLGVPNWHKIPTI